MWTAGQVRPTASLMSRRLRWEQRVYVGGLLRKTPPLPGGSPSFLQPTLAEGPWEQRGGCASQPDGVPGLLGSEGG